MKSATELLLPRTEKAVWERGEEYVNKGKVNVIRVDDKEILAIVSGNEVYETSLKFVASGIRKRCSCPYHRGICKHIVACAIVWDEMRGIKKPDKSEIASQTILPPPISRKDIEKLFKDPLNADLDILRIAVDYSALSPKEHSRLPKCPKIISDEKEALKLAEIKKAFKEMEGWTERRLYHSYFCAGEMAAAFCELLKIIEKRIPASQCEEVIIIMAHCVYWYYQGFSKIIDDSDGVWLFPKVRIGKIVSSLKEKYPDAQAWEEFRKIIREGSRGWEEEDFNEEDIAGWEKIRL
ncbi:MAG: hypothetical protein ABIK97_02470 [candidate division WOR-3 bacterium]